MALDTLATAFVVAVILHNTEEVLWLPAWSLRAGRWHRPVAPRAFRFAVIALTALLVAAGALAVAQGPQSLGAYVFFGYVAVMVGNAVVPHLAATVALRRYMPGTATALGLNVPLGVLLIQEGLDQGWVTLGTLAWAAPAVALTLVASIPVLLTAGQKVMRRWTRGPCHHRTSPDVSRHSIGRGL
jgi:hypothetical protein